VTPLTATQFNAHQTERFESSDRTQSARKISSSHKRFLCRSRSLKASKEFPLARTA